MPFARKTLTQLMAEKQADIAAAIPGTDPFLRFANLRVIAKLSAEAEHAAFGYIDYVSNQATPFKAVDEVAEAWGGLKGVIKKPASAATGFATRGGFAPGVTLPALTGFTRGDGAAYQTTADAVANGGGVITAPILALEAGSAGTLVAGSALTISQAIGGIPSGGWAAVAGVAGADVETQDAYRTRYLQVYAQPPQGGSRTDYPEWALEVPGVTRAWCVPNGLGVGTVVVYTMFDLAEVAHTGFPQGVNGVAAAETRDTPATQDLLAVANHLFGLQPVTALVYSVAPQANTVTFTINLPGATVAAKAQAAAAIAQTFQTFGAPTGIPPATTGVVDMSDINAALTAIPALEGYVITAVACNHGAVSPATGNITSNAGYLPVLGAITWT